MNNYKSLDINKEMEELTMGIKVNMEKARELWRDKIRLARASRWADLDSQWFQATEAGDTETVNQIVNQKQILRDYPNMDTIAEADTIEVLKEIWDNDLLGEK
tara:strand:- start:36747 stop:37055 length:309 start_codon:yes stop_codon:yes gene_type:complete